MNKTTLIAIIVAALAAGLLGYAIARYPSQYPLHTVIGARQGGYYHEGPEPDYATPPSHTHNRSVVGPSGGVGEPHQPHASYNTSSQPWHQPERHPGPHKRSTVYPERRPMQQPYCHPEPMHQHDVYSECRALQTMIRRMIEAGIIPPHLRKHAKDLVRINIDKLPPDKAERIIGECRRLIGEVRRWLIKQGCCHGTVLNASETRPWIAWILPQNLDKTDLETLMRIVDDSIKRLEELRDKLLEKNASTDAIEAIDENILELKYLRSILEDILKETTYRTKSVKEAVIEKIDKLVAKAKKLKDVAPSIVERIVAMLENEKKRVEEFGVTPHTLILLGRVKELLDILEKTSGKVDQLRDNLTRVAEEAKRLAEIAEKQGLTAVKVLAERVASIAEEALKALNEGDVLRAFALYNRARTLLEVAKKLAKGRVEERLAEKLSEFKEKIARFEDKLSKLKPGDKLRKAIEMMLGEAKVLAAKIENALRAGEYAKAEAMLKELEKLVGGIEVLIESIEG